MKADGRFVFTCANCGGIAATLAVSENDHPFDSGTLPDGTRSSWMPDGPAYQLVFVSVSTGKASADLVELVSGLDVLDPFVVRPIDWELASFCCNTCQLNYCSTCWSTSVEFDDGFFDVMSGRCPRGHEQLLDD